MVELVFVVLVCLLGIWYVYRVGQNMAFLWDTEPDGYLGLEVKMLRIDALAKIISIGCVTLAFWVVLTVGLLIDISYMMNPFRNIPRDFTDKFMFILIGIRAVCLFGYEYGQKEFDKLPRRATAAIPPEKYKSILWFHSIYNIGFVAFGIDLAVHFMFRAFL